MSTEEIVTERLENAWDYASTTFDKALNLITAIDPAQFVNLGGVPTDIDTRVDLSEPFYTIRDLAPAMPSGMDTYPATPPEYVDDGWTFPAIDPFPTLVTPTIPTLKDVVIPDFVPTVTIHDFTGVLDDVTIVAPAAVSIDAQQVTYGSALLDALKAKLLTNIVDGGTGLNATVEDAIWNRENEREALALQDAVDKVTGQWAKMGFPLPDGLLSAEILALNTEYENHRLDRARDIAIKNAELEQANLKYSLEYSITIESKFLDLADRYCARALEASKATLDLAIQVFKSNVDLYNVKAMVYKAKADVYASQLQAAKVEVEKYSAQVQAAGMVANVNKLNVELYTAQLEANKVNAQVYSEKIRAIVAEVEAHKAWIEKYVMRVKAYADMCNAVNSKYATKADIYRSRVTAWAANAEADIKTRDVSLRSTLASMELAVREWEAAVKYVEKDFELKFHKAKAKAEIAAAVAQGALAGASAQAGLSYSESANVTPA